MIEKQRIRGVGIERGQGVKDSRGRVEKERSQKSEDRSQKSEDRKWKTEIRSCIFRLNPATHTGIIRPYLINHKREHNKYLQITMNYF